MEFFFEVGVLGFEPARKLRNLSEEACVLDGNRALRREDPEALEIALDESLARKNGENAEELAVELERGSRRRW